MSMSSGLSLGALVQTGDSQATTTIKPVANKVQKFCFCTTLYNVQHSLP